MFRQHMILKVMENQLKAVDLPGISWPYEMVSYCEGFARQVQWLWQGRFAISLHVCWREMFLWEKTSVWHRIQYLLVSSLYFHHFCTSQSYWAVLYCATIVDESNLLTALCPTFFIYCHHPWPMNVPSSDTLYMTGCNQVSIRLHVCRSHLWK